VLAGEAPPPAFSDAVRSDRAPRVVFISVSDGERPAGVAMGAGRGVVAALEQAAEKAQTVRAAFAEPAWLKLDIVQQVWTVATDDLRGYDRSLYGLAFDGSLRVALLPEQLMAYTIADADNRVQAAQMARYLQSCGADVAALDRMLATRDFTSYRFTTTSLFSDGNVVVPLYRGHPSYEEVAPDLLLDAARRGGQYLQSAVEDNGRFIYSYYPAIHGTREDYSIVRHAGTAYSMVELYKVTHDEDLLAAVDSTLGYLLSCAKPGLDGSQETACIVSDGFVKLGGNALTILALAEYVKATGDRSHLPMMRRLGRWIQAVQEPSGRFFIHKQSHPGGRVENWSSIYFPGEAVLAMTRLYDVDPDESWLDTAERGAQYLINVRDADVPLADLSHDHWLLYALNDLYRDRPDPLYMLHAMRIARSIVEAQNRKPHFPDWLGSYYKPPRSTPTATRSEGLCAAYELARDFEHVQQARDILDAIKLGVRFQLQTQFGPESVMYLPCPQRSLGGFHRSLTNLEIRIDYVQHNVSSLLGLRRILLAAGESG